MNCSKPDDFSPLLCEHGDDGGALAGEVSERI